MRKSVCDVFTGKGVISVCEEMEYVRMCVLCMGKGMCNDVCECV